jgi:hypothetical protein
MSTSTWDNEMDALFYALLRLIVGLNVALKGPFPLVGESELARARTRKFPFCM